MIDAVRSHNAANPEDPIKTILCPGLGTAVGRMPYLKCAVQMRTAYDAVVLKEAEAINKPSDLAECCSAHVKLVRVYKTHTITQYTSKFRVCGFVLFGTDWRRVFN